MHTHTHVRSYVDIDIDIVIDIDTDIDIHIHIHIDISSCQVCNIELHCCLVMLIKIAQGTAKRIVFDLKMKKLRFRDLASTMQMQ